MIKNFSKDCFRKDLNPSPPNNSFAISIMNSDDNLLSYFNLNSRWKGTLRLIFDDVDHPAEGTQPFNKEQALRLFEEVLDEDLNLKLFDNIIIHCTAGVSRSAAISLFLNQLQSGHPIINLTVNNLSMYNRYVFSILLEVYNDLCEQKSLPYYHERIRG